MAAEKKKFKTEVMFGYSSAVSFIIIFSIIMNFYVQKSNEYKFF